MSNGKTNGGRSYSSNPPHADNWDDNAAADGLDQHCRAPGGDPCYKLVAVAPELDLSGPYMDIAARRGIRARPVFRIETTWNTPNPAFATEPDVQPAAVFDLPVELQPYQEGRIEGMRPPAAGIWRAGSVVWNRAAWDNVTADQPVGWVCVQPGQPGRWANLSLTL